MGAFTKIWERMMGKQEMRILMVGLDGAGKTTVLYGLKLGEVVTTIPTIGFNVEAVTYRNIMFQVWDIGGQDRIRSLWKHYYRGAEGLIFVVDSSDTGRLDCARDELHRLLGNELLSDCKVLVLANKQDLPKAQQSSDIAERLKLTGHRTHDWYVQGCSAVHRRGLYEGLDWLCTNLQ